MDAQALRSMNVKILAGTFCLVWLALSQSVLAAPPAPSQTPPPNWYNVELIVFRSTDPNAGSLETWPLDPGFPDWNSAQPQVMDSGNPPVPFQSLATGVEQLDDDWTRLKRSKNYEPLLHLSWTQPALDRSVAQAVRVGVAPLLAPPAATRIAASAYAGSVAALSTPVFGIAKLSTTGPYLHFDLDLVLQGPLARAVTPVTGTASINTAVLTPPVATAASAVPSFQYYRLQQDRRVDGGKLTYFDHPLFGAILLVTPVRHSALASPPTP